MNSVVMFDLFFPYRLVIFFIYFHFLVFILSECECLKIPFMVPSHQNKNYEFLSVCVCVKLYPSASVRPSKYIRINRFDLYTWSIAYIWSICSNFCFVYRSICLSHFNVLLVYLYCCGLVLLMYQMEFASKKMMAI